MLSLLLKSNSTNSMIGDKISKALACSIFLTAH